MLRKVPSISHLLLAVFLLATLLPASVMTWMAFSEARDTLEAEIGHDLQARAGSVVTEIDRMMFERLQNVASWSRLEIMQELRVGDIDKRLSRFLDETRTSYSGVYLELHVVDAGQTIVATSEPQRLGQKFSPPASGPGILLSHNGVQAMALAGDRLPLAASIPDLIEGGQSGVLYAVFDWAQVRQVLDTAAADGSSLALRDREGKVLAATAQWQAHLAEPHISASAIAQGYQDFPGFGWSITVAQPKSVALYPVRQMGQAFLLLLLATGVVAVLIVIPVSSSMARPLRRLTDFARNFIREQRAVPPPSGGPSEVRDLSSAFNQMILDLERLKENLIHAAKLAMVGEMSAALSHEVRTPLGILRSSAQLLLRDPGLSAESREVCGFIISETERMNRLLTTLLDSARLRPPDLFPVDLAGLTAEVITMLSAQAGKKHVSMVLAGESDPVQSSVPCDKEQITQVLLNLLLNAIQILPDAGRIEVTIRREPDSIVIDIADDGPGIAAEHLDRVFDPFFTRREGGIGLGLAVVRQIISAHRGEISAGSSRLGGALFSIRLPAVANIVTMTP